MVKEHTTYKQVSFYDVMHLLQYGDICLLNSTLICDIGHKLLTFPESQKTILCSGKCGPLKMRDGAGRVRDVHSPITLSLYGPNKGDVHSKIVI